MKKRVWLVLGLFGALPAMGTLTLEEALTAAHESNPDVQAALHRVEQANAMLQQAQSGWYPQVSLSAGYTRTDNPPQAFFMNLNQRQASLEEDFNQPDDTQNIRGTVGLKMLLADGGVRALAQKMSRMQQKARTALLAAARNELTFAVTEAYYQTLQAGAFVAVQEETIGSVEENLRVAKARFEAGSAIQTDVLNLEVQLADARENLIRAKNRQRLSLAALNTAIGKDLASTLDLAVPPKGEDLVPPPAGIHLAALD
ncbi:MAG: TolC family protein, partial [Kiritimatiellae bacterium]|nr:TolC family protein [Kiritimatiellia bacterium]